MPSLRTTTAALCLALAGFAASCGAALLDREIAIPEAEIQAALSKAGPQQRNYGGWISVALLEAPKITLGNPEGRVGISARIHLALLGNPAVPVDVAATAGIRYDDRAKAFFLESPVVHGVEAPGLPKEAEPGVRQAATNLVLAYFRAKPVYQLRENGTPEEITARWLLRSVRIEPGKVVAILSPF